MIGRTTQRVRRLAGIARSTRVPLRTGTVQFPTPALCPSTHHVSLGPADVHLAPAQLQLVQLDGGVRQLARAELDEREAASCECTWMVSWQKGSSVGKLLGRRVPRCCKAGASASGFGGCLRVPA